MKMCFKAKKQQPHICLLYTSSTVKFHVSNMLQKTGLENKLQLALAVSDVKLIADLAEE